MQYPHTCICQQIGMEIPIAYIQGMSVARCPIAFELSDSHIRTSKNTFNMSAISSIATQNYAIISEQTIVPRKFCKKVEKE